MPLIRKVVVLYENLHPKTYQSTDIVSDGAAGSVGVSLAVCVVVGVVAAAAAAAALAMHTFLCALKCFFWHACEQ
jgi:hypothetical protein